ncbi:uncharacterized protein LOC131225188 isoform X5 [Magnolia sinica]|uniref:uncharacterized protein LOC131225188 isoform X5 n=1 Tax=Magnolia sinica TaxID=86752 RepID=UPI002659C393|nr:uncharacterized protein LOC131225188 isoform X5 [Magnolia sinica]XP_058076644.1 uncharacterized protein LOC131225188 isoform X5 [Magnolia sinica]XP_058076645.1 uncharacterized protein LOC131225188 isoform X5 [Magnolia sinica]
MMGNGMTRELVVLLLIIWRDQKILLCLLLMKKIAKCYSCTVSLRMISIKDKIISWQDPELSTELALSFQEVTGCSYIWDHFRSVQRNQQYRALNNLENGRCPASETPETSMASQTRSNSPPSLGLQ